MIRIIGIDPGLQRTGWGIIDAKGNRLSHVAHGIIKTAPQETLSERLRTVFEGLQHVISQWRPSLAAVEETFVNSNPASALKLGQARGAALLAPSAMNLPVGEYAATVVKKAVVGQGHADKSQVQAMIKVLLPGVEAGSDAADALAVAICHAHHHATQLRMAPALAGGLPG